MDDPESVFVLFLLVVGIAFFSLLTTMIMAELAARRIRKEVTAAKGGRPVPKSVLPLAQMSEVTIEQAAD